MNRKLPLLFIFFIILGIFQGIKSDGTTKKLIGRLNTTTASSVDHSVAEGSDYTDDKPTDVVSETESTEEVTTESTFEENPQEESEETTEESPTTTESTTISTVPRQPREFRGAIPKSNSTVVPPSSTIGTTSFITSPSKVNSTVVPPSSTNPSFKSNTTVIPSSSTIGTSSFITNQSPKAKVADSTTTIEPLTTTSDYNFRTDSSISFKPPYQCSNVKEDLNNDLSYCCNFPRLSVSSDIYFDCQNHCDKLQKYDDKCCMMSCCFRRTGIIVNKVFNVETLRMSLIYFVFGDTIWGDVINESVDFCYQRAVSEKIFNNQTLDCDEIPLHAYRVIDCVYARNYRSCPDIDWNLSGLDFCDGSEKYVEQCLEWP